jgi:cell division protease FtsH
MSELQESMERVVMGPERRTRVISEREKRQIAYHEAGHALVHHHMEHLGPIHKITIVSRGRAGGFVMPLPDNEFALQSREMFEDQIAFAMGGRAAEELTFGQFTTGASNDLQQATRMARAMVTQFGMSDKLGPRSYGSGQQQVFLGREIAEQRDYSERYAQEIDDEVKRILQAGYERAMSVLKSNRDKLEALATILIEQETVDRHTFEDFMDGDNPLPGNLNTAPALFDGD